MDLVKAGTEFFQPGSPLSRSYQTSVGVQRDLGHNMVLTADWARRQVVNANLNEVDLNHYNEFINGVQSPVVPKCAASQFFVLGTQCSSGAFSTYMFQGRSIYEGLLVRAIATVFQGRSIYRVLRAAKSEQRNGGESEQLHAGLRPFACPP